ncbi:MAG: YwiC-like family protein [Nitrospirota bacterium]
MKIPLVKEWGSWAVFFSSSLAALAAGLLTRPCGTGRDFTEVTLLTVLGMTFLINSKNPLASALRTRGNNKEHVLWFLFFSITGLLLLIPFLRDGARSFIMFSPLALTYIIMLYRGKEHSLFTEYNGFALLTLAAPVTYFTVSGVLSLKLYAAVLLFFGAGVFKVRVRTRKTLKYRWIMVLYCIAAIVFYYLMDVPAIILMPLTENLVSVILMREEKLRTTGYTELTKGIMFIILVGYFWK